MKNFVSPHCHPQSLDSATTVQGMVEREVELGTGYATATDHGTMASALDVYSTARKKGLKPILGIEAYFRDDNCEILKAAGVTDVKGYNKYYHCTMHFLDQEAYETACRILSDRSIGRSEVHGGEAKALFTWDDIKELGSKNVTVGSSCLVGMVQRHLMAKRPDLATQYYRALKAAFKPGNFYVEVFPHRCTHNWENNVRLEVAGPDSKEEMKFWLGKKVCVNGETYTAEEYAAHFARLKKSKKGMDTQTLEYVVDMKTKREVGKQVILVEQRKDFVQNECSPLIPDGDIQMFANKFVLGMAAREGDPVIISDDAHYAVPSQKLVQDARLGNGKEMWKFYGHYHRMDTEEAAAHFREHMGATDEQIAQWVENSYAWASRFDKFELKFDVSLPKKFYGGGDSRKYTLGLIHKHGRVDIRDGVYRERLQREIEILHDNGKIDLLPYFFTLEEVCRLYKEKGLLTGPGRGSAAGLLLSYALGITHVDPLKHGLSLERFITKERILQNTLPDIDQDLEDRELLVGADGNSGWLRERFGDCVAQVSTDSNMRLKSSIRDVHRFREGHVSPEIEAVCRKLPVPPQGINDHDYVFGYGDDDGNHIEGIINTNPTLKAYAEKYVEEWDLVSHMMGIPRQKSRHACAYVIADRPIKEFIPLTKISDVVATQYTSKWVELAGGIKVDFLVVNSLKDIRVCLGLIRGRHGKDIDPWTLPEDIEVFRDICAAQTDTVFQLNTSGAKGFLKLFNYTKGGPSGSTDIVRGLAQQQGVKMARPESPGLTSIEDISAFTALDRPGPLDFVDPVNKRNMLQEYAARKRFVADYPERPRPWAEDMPVLDTLLPETYGIIVYQEQLQRVAQEVGGMTPTQANEFRGYVSKKKKVELMQMKALFLKGALEKLEPASADRLWDMMVTFGQYGFNKSHSICYSYIAYACAYLKHHYPKEWWCAVLKNAKKNEVAENFWRHCHKLVRLPDINLSTDSFSLPVQVTEGERIVAPISLMDGIGEATHRELCAKRPFADIVDFVARTDSRLINKGVACKLIASGAADSLFPAEAGLLDKLGSYMRARAEARGEKQEPVPEQFLGLTPLQRHALQKSILTVCEGSATEVILRDPPKGLTIPEGGWPTYKPSSRCKESYIVVNGTDMNRLVEMQVFRPVHIAVVAYIVAERRFAYKNKQFEAVELTLDVDGVIHKTVKWPDRETGVLEAPPKMAKSMAMVALCRYKTDSPFYVDDIRVLV